MFAVCHFHGRRPLFSAASIQLLFPKARDFLILAFGDSGQRENIWPIDVMFASNSLGAEAGRQFQHLIYDLQPVLCRQLTKINLPEKFIQKRTDAGKQDFQVHYVLPAFLLHRCRQFQFAGKE